MSVYEGTKGMLKKLQNKTFEKVNQLLKERDAKIKKNATDILSNAEKSEKELGKLKKETDEKIKQLTEQLRIANDSINEFKKQFQEALQEILEEKST